MKSITCAVLIVLAFIVILASNLSAEIPHQINYQGRLTDGTGDPVDGLHSITFKIYSSSAGGTAVWSETHSSIPVSNGLFNVVLGSVTTLGNAVFASQPRWLGISVDGSPELVPRTQIIAVAYAYHAENADTADYALGAGGWVDDGTVVRLATGTDSVGIGTSDPAEKLHIVGDIRLGTSSSIAFGSDNSRLYSSSTDMIFTADDDIHLQPDDDVYLRREGDATWVHFDNSSQRLGIGIMDPPYKLTVQGELSIASGGVSKYHINYYNGGLNFAETGVSDRRLHIGDGGNVGIGTAAPGARLGVNGDLKVNGAFKGDISSTSGTDGAPFPRPAYDSDWQNINQNEVKLFTHSIGGDPDDYVVDLTFKHSSYAHISGFGLDVNSSGGITGCYWDDLTSTSILVYRGYEDEWVSQVRVRIWVIE